MKKVIINGELYPENEAKISVFDRGFLFSDSVYEVSAVLNGKLVDNENHLLRLNRSLQELGFKQKVNIVEINNLQKQLIKVNGLKEGIVYIQVTRGEESRDFLYSENISSNIVIFTQEKSVINNPNAKTGVKISSVEDIRWKRRDIKTTSLLAQVMAKNYAKQQGSFEAWMIDEDGYITEGASSNAFVIKGNTVITRAPDYSILKGITRNSILEIAEQKLGLQVEQRKFKLSEALEADECFLTSASTFILPIISIDNKNIASGNSGALVQKLREEYIKNVV